MRAILRHIAERAADLPPGVEELIPFAPGDDAQGFRDMVNFRLEQDQGYNHATFRGGSSVLNYYVGASGKALATHAFTAPNPSGVETKYIASHLPDKSVRLSVLGSGASTIISAGDSVLSATEPAQFINNGSFLYVFGPGGAGGHYYDIKRGVGREWLSGTYSGDVTGVEWVEGGNFEEANIWGFRKGAPVYSLRNLRVIANQNSQYITAGRVQLPARSLVRFTWETGNKKITIDGTVYDSTTLLHFATDKSFALGAGDSDPIFDLITYGYVTLDGRVRYGTIPDAVSELVLSGGKWVLNLRDTGLSRQRLPAIPVTAELRQAYESMESAYKVSASGGDVISNNDYTEPNLVRAYLVVDMLADGSVLTAGRPAVVSTTPAGIYEDATGTLFQDGFGLKRRGVKLTLTPPGPGVVKRFLYATRWHAEISEALKGVTDTGPNSAYYRVSELDVATLSVDDFTADRDLILPLQSLLPMAGGVSLLFAPGQLAPMSVGQFRGALAIGGYRVSRPQPKAYNNVDGSALWYGTPSQGRNVYVYHGSFVPGGSFASVSVYFEYADGTKSTPATIALKDSENRVQLHSLNALVVAVDFVCNPGAGPLLLRRVTTADPEFFGAPFDLPNDISDIDGPEYTLPGATGTLDMIDLDKYVMVSAPMQQMRIDSQQRIFGNDAVQAIVPIDFDPDRSTMRYRVAVLTTGAPNVGYIVENITGEGSVFSSDFEQANQKTGTRSRYGAFLLNGNVVYQSDHGISLLAGNKVTTIVDRRRYAMLEKRMTGSAWNSRFNELWMCFDDEDVLVYDAAYNLVRRVSYSYPVSCITSLVDELFVGVDMNTELPQILKTDQDALHLDGYFVDGATISLPISGYIDSEHLSSLTTRLRFTEIIVYGQNTNLSVSVDAQHPRREGASDTWVPGFTGSYTIGPKNITMGGALYPVHEIGRTPRIRLTGVAQSESRIAEMLVRFVALEHKGKGQQR